MFLKCCSHHIKVSLCEKINKENFIFWLERFCPGVEKEENCDGFEIEIECIESSDSKIVESDNKVKIYGDWCDSEDFSAKYVTQVIQRLLVSNGELIIPGACVKTSEGHCILFVGDFWQGKTMSALNYARKFKKDIVSDNYVLIKNGKVFGGSKYLSTPLAYNSQLHDNNVLHKVEKNNRFFYENKYICENNVEMTIEDIFIPHINNGRGDKNVISKDESIWFLYQKFTRMLSGETVLFHGALPSPCYLNETNSKVILELVKKILEKSRLIYISSGIEEMPNIIGEY